VAEEPYLQLLRDLGAVVQFSFCSTLDRLAVRAEPHAAPPSTLLRAMETLAQHGIAVTCRWQPYIPGLSERPTEFVRRVARTGCQHVAFEHLKVPLESATNWSALSTIDGRDLRAHFRAVGATRDGREYVLPALIKLPTMLEARNAVHAHGLSFGAADNEFQYLSDSDCCCSGVDQFPGFENFFRHQIGYAIRRARGHAEIRYQNLARHWSPSGSIDRYLNNTSRLSSRSDIAGTLSEHMRERWNNALAPGNPSSFFGVTPSNKLDSAGNMIYRWDFAGGSSTDHEGKARSELQSMCVGDGTARARYSD
jgi:hypothetical protein